MPHTWKCMDQHEVIEAVKNLALELGRSPTRREYEKTVKGARYRLDKYFDGNFSLLLTAAGLEPAPTTRVKITNKVFERDIVSHLENYQPRDLKIEVIPYPTIASISDIHWPFGNKKVIEKFLDFVEKNQPQYVFINGDAWDMYSFSKYPRSHNIFTPKEEQAQARKMNEEFWAEVRKRSPKSKCIQLMGNHDVRPLKRILEVLPAAEDWIEEKLKQLFSFEGVETVMDSREEYKIGDILVFHGYKGKLGDHRDHTLYNCINGHTHKGGAVFREIRGQTLWELNSGVAGDPQSKGLTYTPQKITGWTPGFCAVDEHGPRFIPVR